MVTGLSQPGCSGTPRAKLDDVRGCRERSRVALLFFNMGVDNALGILGARPLDT